jgi:hypothetical protein
VGLPDVKRNVGLPDVKRNLSHMLLLAQQNCGKILSRLAQGKTKKSKHLVDEAGKNTQRRSDATSRKMVCMYKWPSADYI